MQKLNKKQVLADFKENIMPAVVSKYGKNDKAAICEAWNEYTDMLCKDGLITMKQYESWDNPF